MALDGYYIKKIGKNRGSPRVWLEGTQTKRAGFKPGQKYDLVIEGHTIVLQANEDGSRVVSGKKDGDKVNPIIDINSKELLAIFDGMSAIRVIVEEGKILLLPLATELKKQDRFTRLKNKLMSGEPLDGGSLSHGGGILAHAIHSGLKKVGVPTRLAFVSEIREELLEHAAIHNDAWDEKTIVFSAPMQELAFDPRGLAEVPKVDYLDASLACSGASLSGKSKLGLAHAESHPHVGHLIVSAIVIINQANPAIIIWENVVQYASSASAEILSTSLKDMGYTTHEKILNGKEWGSLENRTRWCLVAVTEGIDFDFDSLVPPAIGTRTMGEILENVPDNDPRWNRQEGLKSKLVRDIAAKKGFKMQIITADSEHCGVIGKGYIKRRTTEPFVQNKNDPSMLRLLTPTEHAAVKDIEPHLIANLSPTIAHEVMGQSVTKKPWEDGVAAHVGRAINRFAEKYGFAPQRDLPPTAAYFDEAGNFTSEFEAFASEVVATFEFPVDGYDYGGPIVAIDRDLLIQDVGNGHGIVYKAANLDAMPKLGEEVEVQYEDGVGRVKLSSDIYAEVAAKVVPAESDAGYYPPEKAQWSNKHAFPIDNLGDKQALHDWFIVECAKAEEEGQAGKYDQLDLFDGDPIVVFVGANEAHVWGDKHRVGAAIRAGMTTIPAIVGRAPDAPSREYARDAQRTVLAPEVEM